MMKRPLIFPIIAMFDTFRSEAPLSHLSTEAIEGSLLEEGSDDDVNKCFSVVYNDGFSI